MNRRTFLLSSTGLWLAGAPAIVRAITPQQRAAVLAARPPVPVASAGSLAAPDVLWYKLNEGSGSSLTDSSSRGNTGTLENADMWDTVGSYTGIKGAVSRQAYTASTLAPGSAVLTVAYWMYAASWGSGTTIIFECASTPYSADNSWAIWTGDSLTGLIWNGGNYRTESHANASTSAWHHYLWVFDNAAGSNKGSVNLWIDGEAQTMTLVLDQKTASGNFADSQMFFLARVGNNIPTVATIDDIRIWSTNKSGDVSAIISDRQ